MNVAPEAWSGFADPVLDAQSAFRTIMTAMARPGTVADLATGELRPPRPLTPALAAVALTLCDHKTPVWLDTDLAAAASVASYIQFYTGAPLVDDPAAAAGLAGMKMRLDLPIFSGLGQFGLYILSLEKQHLGAAPHQRFRKPDELM